MPGLRALQRLLSRPRLTDAFGQAETVLPELKREVAAGRRPARPTAFRAAIIGHGEPDDVDRYRRLFGAPADDPTLARLEAVAAEDRHAWAAAHKLWQRFEQSMIDNPAWPAADRDRARAFVWCRMGRNADDAAEAGRRLQPNAETCFKRAIELAPDLLEPHEQLFLMLAGPQRRSQRDRGRQTVARSCSRTTGRPWRRWPNCARPRATSPRRSNYARRAVAANPLDRRLRGPAGRDSPRPRPATCRHCQLHRGGGRR